MRNLFLMIAVIGLMAAGCGGSQSEVEAKKEALKSLQAEAKALKAQIAELEKDIIKLDPEFGKKEIKKTLITTIHVKRDYFEHKIEVRGSVESRKNVSVSPEVPGKVDQILVREGQRVNKGQTLLTLDASVIRNTIAELKTAMELPKTMYEKQSNLWKKNIGTEIQYLQAKNKYESLERQLATAKSQLAQAMVKAPFGGTIDEVDARVGELAQPGMPLIRIVNPEDVYIKSDISERFIGAFKKGDKVELYLPAQDTLLVTTIKSVGRVINSQNRTFEVEIEVPRGIGSLSPNQVAVLKLRDYKNEQAVKVPTMIIQQDSRGSYVYRVVEENGNLIAKKAHIKTGVSYKGETEVLSGIQAGQTIADKGHRDLAESVHVEVTEDTAEQ